MTDKQLAYTFDNYCSVWPHPNELPADAEAFAGVLQSSLRCWRDEGVLRVWLKLPPEKAQLIPVAIAQGFSFHFVQDGAVVLVLALEDGIFIPHQASHHVGAGGLTVNENGDLLVIAENTGPKRGGYKIPGGYIEEGEHIAEGIVREIEEETGVKTRFDSIIMVRHMHKTLFQKSNVYFVCRLVPLSAEITLDPTEIAECFWMPIDDFLAHPNTQDFHRGIVSASLRGGGLVANEWTPYKRDPDRTELFGFGQTKP